MKYGEWCCCDFEVCCWEIVIVVVEFIVEVGVDVVMYCMVVVCVVVFFGVMIQYFVMFDDFRVVVFWVFVEEVDVCFDGVWQMIVEWGDSFDVIVVFVFESMDDYCVVQVDCVVVMVVVYDFWFCEFVRYLLDWFVELFELIYGEDWV